MQSEITRHELLDTLPARSITEYVVGDSIYRQGDSSETFFLVRSGLVGVTFRNDDGINAMQLFSKDEFFGDELLRNQSRTTRTEAAEARTAVQVMQWKICDILLRAEQHPKLALALMYHAYEKASRYEAMLVRSAHKSRLRQVAGLLVKLGEAFGEQNGFGVRITQHFTQDNLAAMIPTRREVVTGAMGRLRSYGLISYSRNHITIHDMDALADCSFSD